MFKQRFQCELGWNEVKYAHITITYVFFNALHLSGPSDDVEHEAYRPRVQTASSGPSKC